MYVVATAGHVDHGKSTLVRALTGMEPDRWAEERRRGLTIDLGFAWSTLPSGARIAFVDVPGHERFVTNMLAGLGPAPAVMLVVAADEGWMPQSEEHLQAIAALGTPHLLLVVTKGDLGPADATLAQARARIDAVGLPQPAAAVVSATAGEGLTELRRALDELVARSPAPDVDAPIRLWVDRAFTIRGAGTVVTGTLSAGRLKMGDALTLLPAQRQVVVRGLQSLHTELPQVEATARVAVNLRGVDRDDIARGMALVTAGDWTSVAELDVLGETTALPTAVVAHIGAAAVPATLRPLGDKAARLRLSSALPLHYGDRLLLRDPASRAVAAVDVADLRPRPLRRRGDARAVGDDLRVPADADEEVTRRGLCTVAELRAAGLAGPTRRAVAVDDWRIDPDSWAALRAQLHTDTATATAGVDAGVPLSALRRQLDLPADRLVAALVAELPDRRQVGGRVRPVEQSPVDLPGLDTLLKRLAEAPLDAPDADELADLGLGRAELAHAVRTGLLTRLAEGVYVAAGADETALGVLAGLDQPFTVAAARQRLGSTRRVVVPLLEHLDATRRTRRLPDGKRLLTPPSA